MFNIVVAFETIFEYENAGSAPAGHRCSSYINKKKIANTKISKFPVILRPQNSNP